MTFNTYSEHHVLRNECEQIINMYILSTPWMLCHYFILSKLVSVSYAAYKCVSTLWIGHYSLYFIIYTHVHLSIYIYIYMYCDTCSNLKVILLHVSILDKQHIHVSETLNVDKYIIIAKHCRLLTLSQYYCHIHTGIYCMSACADLWLHWSILQAVANAL